MIAALRGRRWASSPVLPPTLIAALCVALAVLVCAELAEPTGELAAPPPRATAAAAPVSAGELPSAAFALRPLEAYAAVTARPLFTPTRRPPEPPAPPVVGSDDFVLAGIVSTATERMALIRRGQPPKTVRLKEGEALAGWTVRSILADRVVIEAAGTTRELKLREASGRGGGG